MSKKIWGMSGNGHDASFAVFYDDKLMMTNYSSQKFHNQEEIDQARKRFGKPDLVVWYENPYLKGMRQLLVGQKNPIKRNNVRNYLDLLGLDCKWTYVPHHKAHAGWYYESPFDEALVFVIDAIGEFDCTSVWKGKKNKLKKLGSVKYPDSMGLFFSSMTQQAGYQPGKDEGRISRFYDDGHGKPNEMVRNKLFSEVIISHKWKPMYLPNMHRGLGNTYFGNSPRDYELAFETQYAFNTQITRMVEYWQNKTGITNIIFSGGCAFNQHLKKLYPDCWIPENPGDGGSCVGAVRAKLRK
jgi:carbamoyltransferase